MIKHEKREMIWIIGRYDLLSPANRGSATRNEMYPLILNEEESVSSEPINPLRESVDPRKEGFLIYKYETIHNSF